MSAALALVLLQPSIIAPAPPSALAVPATDWACAFETTKAIA